MENNFEKYAIFSLDWNIEYYTDPLKGLHG